MERKQNLSQEAIFITVLKHYKLFQAADLYKVVCPFHGDKNPSMQINIKQQYWYCFGCGLHGSSLELVKNFNPNMSTLEAYSELSKITKGRGVIGGGLSAVHTTTLKTKPTYSEGLKLAKDYYYNLPDTNWYKPDEENFGIKRYLLKRGFTTKTLTAYSAKGTYNKNYPVVFPLLENSIFRGYVMRTDDPNVEAERKYMYNSGFKRRKCLIGTYTKEKPVLIVEGYLDMLAAKQLGIENVVAILGWKLSSEQIEKLKRKQIPLVICGLDNAAVDKAGKQGYEYLLRISRINHFSVERIRYPKGIKDFGDLLNNPTASEQVLRQLKNILKK